MTKKEKKTPFDEGLAPIRTKVPRADFEEPSRNEDEDARSLGGIMGGCAGEADQDVVPGGWEGTDDATSTAPSDLSPEGQRLAETPRLDEEDRDSPLGRAYGGGLGATDGGITDIKGTPVEESRDWEHDPVVDDEQSGR